jgi:hypothetical protein
MRALIYFGGNIAAVVIPIVGAPEKTGAPVYF